MRTLLLAAVFGFVCGIFCLSAACAEDELATIIQHNLAYAQALQPARCTYLYEGKTNGKFSKIAVGEAGWRRNGYFFDYVQQDEGRPVTWSEYGFFDGARSGDFYRHEGQLGVESGKYGCPVMDGKNVLLEPYVFLTGKRFTRKGYYLTFDEMSDPAEWKTWANSARVSRREAIDGHECVVVACDGGKSDGWMDPPFTMLVWFDSQRDYYPVRWQRISDKEQLLDDYWVEKFGYLDDAKKGPYPEVFSFASYTFEGKPNGVSRRTVTQLETNARLPDRDFSVDPILAGLIYDADVKKNVNIFYPRSPARKKSLLTTDKVMALLYAGSASKSLTAPEPPAALNDEPVRAQLLSDVIKRTGDDDFTVFYDLAATRSTQAVPVLLHYISLNDAPDETRAVAAGAALAKMGAENDLRNRIMQLSQESNLTADAHRAEMFNALAFMRSAGAVWVAASFLDEADLPGPVGYLKNARHNPTSAVVTLDKMMLPKAPRMEFLTHQVREADLEAWREWWNQNRAKYEEKGA